jgi:pseudouridine-5'-phosphate glycosidase
MGRKEDGATTVAATMFLASIAGIQVLSTAGIGGVHRDHPFDISADLIELSHTPITVVCSGAKVILDLPSTMEVLETQGVTVIGYQTDELPAFYTNTSGLPVDVRCDTPEEVACIVHERDLLGLPGGLLVTVPVPSSDALSASEIDAVVAQSLALAEAQNIRGKAVTPFLLARIRELTGDASQHTNITLLLNNAGIAADFANALVKRYSQH